MTRRKQAGFTLIELIIATAIMAILAALAYPQYTGYVMRSNRAAAKAQMLDIANRQQQFLLASRAYASKTALETSGYSLPRELAGKYTYEITVGAGTVPAFTVTFTAAGMQEPDGNLTLNSEGLKTPASKW
jgi:type IV pilus assembly protein PilE